MGSHRVQDGSVTSGEAGTLGSSIWRVKFQSRWHYGECPFTQEPCHGQGSESWGGGRCLQFSPKTGEGVSGPATVTTGLMEDHGKHTPRCPELPQPQRFPTAGPAVALPADGGEVP